MDKNARTRLLTLGLFLLLGFGQVTLQSQTTSTEILGLVTDPTGAVVPGAQVTIMKELGHFPMSENPALFLSYVEPVLADIAARG